LDKDKKGLAIDSKTECKIIDHLDNQRMRRIFKYYFLLMLVGCTSTKDAVVLSPYPAGMLGETKGDFVELFDGKTIKGPITEIKSKTITINGNTYNVKQIKSFEYRYVYKTMYEKHFIARFIKGKINVYTRTQSFEDIILPDEKVAGKNDRIDKISGKSSTYYYLQKGDDAEIKPFDMKLLEEMISDNNSALDYLNKYKALKKKDNKYLDKAIETYNMT